MCDETTFSKQRRDTPGLTRRDFGALSVGASIAMMLPRTANAVDATVTEIDVPTPDGVADCYFAHPATGSHPAIVIWPDARGIRNTYRQLAVRLAESSYSVLVVNPYYRGIAGRCFPTARILDRATRWIS